jgi:hypothetical protein
MKETLISYLLQHKSLCIPGLGTIYVERTPAQNDFVNKRILPPGYHFRFDQYFDQPDKEFFTYIAKHLGMADFEAIKWYNEWAYEVRSQLRTASVTWKGIGTLHKDDSGEVVFEAERVQHTAFKTVEAKRHHEWEPVPVPEVQPQPVVITGIAEVEDAMQDETTSDTTNEFEYPEELFGSPKTDNWWVYAIILGAIALSIIFFYFYGNGASGFGLGSAMPVKLK